jgi:hypothetical protein
MSKIYIAGPMTGYPNFNFDNFNRVAALFEARGWQVLNPANKGPEWNAVLDEEAVKTGDGKLAIEKGFDFRRDYTWDVSKVIEADAIYMMKGWQFSPGAVGEHAVAVAMKRHFPEYQIIYEDSA